MGEQDTAVDWGSGGSGRRRGRWGDLARQVASTMGRMLTVCGSKVQFQLRQNNTTKP